MRVAYSCVCEASPKYAVQLRIWLTTLLELARVPRDHIVVHLLADADNRNTARYLDEQGIAHRTIQRFGDGRYCNKIAQLDSDFFAAFDYAVLCDTDLAFCDPLDRWVGLGRIAAKPVDYANPPLEMLDALYGAAGFRDRPRVVRCSSAADPTYANNCNGGLYVMATEILPAFAPAWKKWAGWTMAQPLDRYSAHVDQISFGLAAWELHEPVVAIPNEANLPTHVPLDRYSPTLAAPAVLHYHDNLAPDATLNPVGLGVIDQRVHVVNEALRRAQHASFDNKLFWDFRYAEHAATGAGIGSRGANAAAKRRIVASVVAPGASVLDIGCGDLTIVEELEVAAYTGVDVSDEAVRLARAKKPGWRFVAGDVLELDLEPADVVLCLDVLNHQPDPAGYRAAVGRLAALARNKLLVSGYNQPPWHTSQITYYHESLAASIFACGQFRTVEIVGGYRDTTVLLATR